MRISLIIPTGNRAILLRRALAQIARQTRLPDEVVIVDGGTRPFRQEPWLGERGLLGLASIPVRYFRISPESTTGARRNLAVEKASGDVIAHWDDDDFYAPDYLAELAKWFEEMPVDLGGACQFWHYDFLLRRGWRTQLWDAGGTNPYGATFIYSKRIWNHVGRFPDLQRGEDQEFFEAVKRKGFRTRATERPDLYVYMRHTRNVSLIPEPIIHPEWTKAARAVLGDDVAFYDDLAELVAQKPAGDLGPQWHLPNDIRAFRGVR